jgi:hypothetical protein
MGHFDWPITKKKKIETWEALKNRGGWSAFPLAQLDK